MRSLIEYVRERYNNYQRGNKEQLLGAIGELEDDIELATESSNKLVELSINLVDGVRDLKKDISSLDRKFSKMQNIIRGVCLQNV